MASKYPEDLDEEKLKKFEEDSLPEEDEEDSLPEEDAEKKTKEWKIEATKLSLQDVNELMTECMAKAYDRTDTRHPENAIRSMMTGCQWNYDKLKERYKEDKKKILYDARFAIPADNAGDNAGDNDLMCVYCLNAAEESSLRLTCGHLCCKACLELYFSLKIQNKEFMIACAGCLKLVPDSDIMRAIGPNCSEEYDNVIWDYFIRKSTLVTRCPSELCTKIFKAEFLEPGSRRVICDCGREFCVGCGEKWHDPAKCSWLIVWNAKESLEWIDSKTKLCPKCGVVTYKDGECDWWIKCSDSNCWKCLGILDESYRHIDADNICGSGTEGAKMTYKDARSKFTENKGLFKDAEARLNIDKTRLTSPTAQGMLDSCDRFRKAVKVLLECRVTAMYGYVFAFFCPNKELADVFKIHHKALEMQLIELSKKLHNAFLCEGMGTAADQIEIQELSANCDRHRRLLLSHAFEGLPKPESTTPATEL